MTDPYKSDAQTQADRDRRGDRNRADADRDERQKNDADRPDARAKTNKELIDDAKKNNPTMMNTVTPNRAPAPHVPDMSVQNNTGVPGGMLDGSNPTQMPPTATPQVGPAAAPAPAAPANAPARNDEVGATAARR